MTPGGSTIANHGRLCVPSPHGTPLPPRPDVSTSRVHSCRRSVNAQEYIARQPTQHCAQVPNLRVRSRVRRASPPTKRRRTLAKAPSRRSVSQGEAQHLVSLGRETPESRRSTGARGEGGGGARGQGDGAVTEDEPGRNTRGLSSGHVATLLRGRTFHEKHAPCQSSQQATSFPP